MLSRMNAWNVSDNINGGNGKVMVKPWEYACCEESLFRKIAGSVAIEWVACDPAKEKVVPL